MVIDAGVAAFFAAIISTFFALISLLFSIKAQRDNLQLESRLKTMHEVGQEKRQFLNQQLSEFYNPIFTLLSVNRKIYERVGPGSQARDNASYSTEDIKNIWRELRQTVVIPNNLRICEIIENKLQLLSDEDVAAPYLEFTVHAHAFKALKSLGGEQYELFPIPEDFSNHVFRHRERIEQILEATMQT